MARDPLRMLRTVRRQSVEQARHALAVCLAIETAAAGRLRAIDEATERDRVADRAVVESYLFTDMFARRLQISATERLSAEADWSAAHAAFADAGAALVAARTAEEAVQTLILERAQAADATARRSEQHALDDMARTRFDTAKR